MMQEMMIVEDARTRTGDRYAWWRLFSYLGERITLGKIPFSKLHFLRDRNVCSNHAGLAWQAAGIYLPESPGRLDPDDLMDYCDIRPKLIEFMGWAIVP
jgi:hypothetical protein